MHVAVLCLALTFSFEIFGKFTHSIRISERDACVVPVANESLIRWEETLDCMKGINSSAQMRSDAMQTIQKTMMMYAFRDVVLNSPPDGDIQKELNRIANTQYEYDFQFQEDPHTVYLKPAYQPFVLSSRMEGGEQVIFIKNVTKLASNWVQQFNIDPQQFIGKTISTFDNENALKHLVSYCLDSAYISKDLGSLFNFVLTIGFMSRRMVVDAFPKHSNITYQFVGDLSPVAIPWLFGSVDDPVKLTDCLNQNSTTPSWEGANEFLQNDSPTPLMPSSDSPTEILPLFTSSSISLSVLSSDVLVMRITDFVPGKTRACLFTQENNTEFLDIVAKTIELADIYSVPYLILDLRSNGGGDICLGYQVINALMEEHNPYGRYDIIHSNATTLLAEAFAQPDFEDFFFSPETWVDPQTQIPYSNISWYSPGHTFSRGGVSSTYSNWIHLACDEVNSPVRYLFKKIIMLTNGLCGEADHVESLVIGGLNAHPQQYFSFPGGQVFRNTAVNSMAEVAEITSHFIPSPLPYDALVTFTLQEIYAWHPNVTADYPLEFDYRPATHRLFQWDFESEIALYKAVVPYFKDRK